MRSGTLQGIVVMGEWEDLGCAAYQSRSTKGHEIKFLNIFLGLPLCENQ